MAFQERKWEHVWVEAFLDYVPSRGERPRAGDTWIPMDPSLKQHDLTGAILQAGIVGYFAQTWGKGQIMARTANVLLYRLPSVGTLSTASTVTFWFGVPRRFIPSGVAFDVDRNALSSAARDDDRARRIAFNRSYNQILSAHEHSVLEDMFSTPDQPVLGVSTVKAIAVAAQQGQRIYTITQENLSTALSQISLPSDVETDIANAVNAGFQVTTHQTDIQYAGLVTAGYAIEDPNTGVGAMLISSGASGGFLHFFGIFLLILITYAVSIAAIAVTVLFLVEAGGIIAGFLSLFGIFVSIINLLRWNNDVSSVDNDLDLNRASFRTMVAGVFSYFQTGYLATELGILEAAVIFWFRTVFSLLSSIRP